MFPRLSLLRLSLLRLSLLRLTLEHPRAALHHLDRILAQALLPQSALLLLRHRARAPAAFLLDLAHLITHKAVQLRASSLQQATRPV